MKDKLNNIVDNETFQTLSNHEVAELVQAAGCKVCVFPINGTRRWFILEHPQEAAQNFVDAYLRITGERHLDLYRLIFDHGIQTLLTPIFGPDILERDSDYQPIIEQGLLWLAESPEFLAFYDAYEVKVRVYGDAERMLRDTPYASVLSAFKSLEQRTSSYSRHRLFFGVGANDPAERIAQISVEYFQRKGLMPDKRSIVEAYFGEYVDAVDFFIGFDRLSAYDMPLIATGEEDLYFMVSPSPYLDTETFRHILYDHLYSRKVNEVYSDMSSDDWQTLALFYRQNRHHVLGVGRKTERGGIWYPLPQVNLPSQW